MAHRFSYASTEIKADTVFGRVFSRCTLGGQFTAVLTAINELT